MVSLEADKVGRNLHDGKELPKVEVVIANMGLHYLIAVVGNGKEVLIVEVVRVVEAVVDATDVATIDGVINRIDIIVKGLLITVVHVDDGRIITAHGRLNLV